MRPTKPRSNQQPETAMVAAPQEVPDYITRLDEHDRAGLEAVRPQDVIMPRLLIMQALSPGVIAGDHRPGQIVHAGTMDVLAEPGQELQFGPFMHRIEWIRWAPRDSKRGILERSRDPNCDMAKQVTLGIFEEERDGMVTKITEYHNFFATITGSLEPVVISCGRTNHKHGRRLLQMAITRQRGSRIPLASMLFSVRTAQESNVKGTYFVFNFANAGFPSREQYELNTVLHKTYMQLQVTTTYEDPETEAEGNMASTSDGKEAF